MKSRILYAASAMTVGFLAIVAAQSVPSAPQNLRIVTQPPAKRPTPTVPECVVPPAVGGAHGFFDALVRRTEHFCNWSLRSQEQLQSLVNAGLDATKYWTYSPSTDKHAHRQDAAKFVKPQYDRFHECTTIYGKVRFTGAAGVVVPKGTVLTRPSDGATYRTIIAATIGSDGASPLVRIDAVSPTTYQAAAPAGTVLNVASVVGIASTAVVQEKNDVTVRCSDSMPIQYQLRMPINVTSGSILITWDWYYTPEFRDNVAGLSSYKMFKLQANPSVSGSWWTMLASFRDRSANAQSIGTHFETPGGSTMADGQVSSKPYTPTGPGAVPARKFELRQGVWTRYWVEVKMFQPPSAFKEWSAAYLGGAPLSPNADDPEGRWHMGSVWIADENRDPVPVLYRAPISWPNSRDLEDKGSISRFDFEMNTSDLPPAQGGPLVGYGRNVVMLTNYNLPSAPLTDTLIFKRPSR